MRAKTYLAGSLVAALVVIWHAFATREQFFPSMVYLYNSKLSIAILGNLGFAVALSTYKIMTWAFLGRLRDSEVERINDKISQAIVETLLAMTIFRQDFTVGFFAAFVVLSFVKIFHWMVQDRVDFIETTPNVTRSQHARIVAFLFLLMAIDYALLRHALASTLSRGVSIYLLFAFEYAIQASTAATTLAKYFLSVADMAMGGRWEGKGVAVFYLELALDLLHLITYTAFFAAVFSTYGIPIHLVRDLYWTFRNFQTRVRDFLRYRRVAANMDARFPDATEEDLARADHVCIVCREEMGPGTRAKKLDCGHSFHVHCLRSWLERQQNCPICRAPVLATEQRRPQAAQGGAGGGGGGGGAADGGREAADAQRRFNEAFQGGGGGEPNVGNMFDMDDEWAEEDDLEPLEGLFRHAERMRRDPAARGVNRRAAAAGIADGGARAGAAPAGAPPQQQQQQLPPQYAAVYPQFMQQPFAGGMQFAMPQMQPQQQWMTAPPMALYMPGAGAVPMMQLAGHMAPEAAAAAAAAGAAAVAAAAATAAAGGGAGTADGAAAQQGVVPVIPIQILIPLMAAPPPQQMQPPGAAGEEAGAAAGASSGGGDGSSAAGPSPSSQQQPTPSQHAMASAIAAAAAAAASMTMPLATALQFAPMHIPMQQQQQQQGPQQEGETCNGANGGAAAAPGAAAGPSPAAAAGSGPGDGPSGEPFSKEILPESGGAGGSSSGAEPSAPSPATNGEQAGASRSAAPSEESSEAEELRRRRLQRFQQQQMPPAAANL